MLRLKLLACKVLYREVSLLSATNPNILDVSYLRQGLHNTPEKLKKALENEISKLDSGDDIYSFEPSYSKDFDAILLGYGLCSNAIVGLSSRKYKIVIPRAHDCITLFLGSKEKYRDYFDQNKGGIYWYTPGWIENTIMPGEERIRILREKYEREYGEENANFLLETEQNWLKEYNNCTYVNWKEIQNKNHINYAKQCSDYLAWNFNILEGNPQLLKDFLAGNWNENDFCIVPPGSSIKQSYDENIIKF